MKQVHSSHIEAIGYEDGNLIVQYKSGKVAVHAGVPEDIANQVINSGSVGTALHLLVKGTYPHEYKS